MGKTLLVFTVAAFLCTTAYAQSRLTRKQEGVAATVIVKAGGQCERVTRTQAIVKLRNRNLLMAVACKGGGKFVIEMDERANMQFYATCDALAKANNNLVRCFVHQLAPRRTTTR